MKKFKASIRIATLALSIFAVVGIAILIFDNNNASRTIYELIAFTIGVCAIVMAILEQLNTRRLERRLDHIQDEMLVLLKAEHEDEKDGKYIRSKITEILANHQKTPVGKKTNKPSK